MEECNCKNILNLQPQCPVVLNISEGAGSGAGTLYHDELLNRDLSNQHPISAITDLQNSLDTLQTNINNEASARETADNALEGDIQAEATAREQADTRLEGLISTEETRAKAAEESLSDDISAENTRAVNAEETLQDNIDAEETRAKNAEQGLSDDISSEAGTRASEITRVEGLITAEETARISADNTLQGNIDAEETARENADSALQDNIDAEELARQNADSALQSNIDAEALARGNADTALNTKIDNHIADKANPHQVTKAQVGLGNVDNTADIDKPISTAVSAAFDAVEAEITDINDLIPNEASSSNQLADKAFVNSSISTNTANFIGTFNSVAELEAYSGTVTNNDYAFVVGTDSAGNTVYDRYKYTDATTPSSWVFEYELNNSSFTAAQWNAINSGATSALVGQITTNQGNITTIQTTMSGYGNIVTHNVSEFATAAQGTKADTAVQPADLATVATSGSYNDLDDKPTIGNATLTIQKNGTAVDTFTANATADKAINITVPTDTSDLTNGAGYITGITSSDVTTALGYTPYNSSNPSGYQTASDVATAIAGKQDTLVSGTNIKTINNNSILGSGNLNIDGLPSQTGQNGKFLSTDGTNPSWQNVDALPSQTGQAGKYLTTDGTNPSWNTIAIPSVDVDGISINRNTNDELQAIGLINKNPSGSTIYDWEGTLAQYEAQNIETLHPEWTCLITDDLSPNIYPMRNLGEIVQSTIPLADAGLHLLDGSLISGSGAYADFVTYIAGLVSTYPDLFDTEANWQQSVTTYGVCGKFVYDSVNNTVRLPKITGFTEGTITPTTLGDLTEAGLPNITGEYGQSDCSAFTYNPMTTGAFYKGTETNAYFMGRSGQSSNTYGYLHLDASRSSSIYGNSSTVQPQSIKVLYYIVIATSTKTQIEVDIDEIATDLNGKADVDLSNCTVLEPCHVVVETYVNGTSWYRVYDDGWCEQGGYVSNLPSDSYVSVTFIKEFGNTNYFFHNQIECNRAIGTGWDGGSADEVYTSRTTTGTEVTGDGISNTKTHYGFFWEAKGYIN